MKKGQFISHINKIMATVVTTSTLFLGGYGYAAPIHYPTNIPKQESSSSVPAQAERATTQGSDSFSESPSLQDSTTESPANSHSNTTGDAVEEQGFFGWVKQLILTEHKGDSNAQADTVEPPTQKVGKTADTPAPAQAEKHVHTASDPKDSGCFECQLIIGNTEVFHIGGTKDKESKAAAAQAANVNTLFDDHFMETVRQTFAKEGDYDGRHNSHAYAQQVAHAFVDLYNRLPARLVGREHQDGNVAVPLLRKDVEFEKLPVLALALAKQPKAAPGLGVRFRVVDRTDPANQTPCGVQEGGFDGFFHFSVVDSANRGGRGWKTALSKNVFSHGAEKAIGNCLAGQPSFWGGTYYNTPFGPQWTGENERRDQTLRQVEALLLLVRDRIAYSNRPFETPYALELDMSAEHHKAFIAELRKAGQNAERHDHAITLADFSFDTLY